MRRPQQPDGPSATSSTTAGVGSEVKITSAAAITSAGSASRSLLAPSTNTTVGWYLRALRVLIIV